MKRWLIILSIALTASIPVFSEELWVNWLGNTKCNPALYAEPKTLDELRNVIKRAVSEGYNIRVVGSGYSRNNIVSTDGLLISLKYLNRLFLVDLENNLVRIEAGITIQELNPLLARYGLALPNQAAIDKISLGGALSTGVHGTGHTGTFSSFVKNIELVTADGKLHHLSETSDPEAFAAAKVSLGALGVIYAVTIQCEPLFILRDEYETISIQDLLNTYKELFSFNDFFQFEWNIQSDKVRIKKWNRYASIGPQTELSSPLKVCYKSLVWYEIDPEDKDVSAEIAIPIDSLPDALREIKVLIEKYKNFNTIISDVGVRFVEVDDHSYLSPASEGPKAYISICSRSERGEFYQEFETLLFNYGGRPHWGKIHFLDYSKIVELYGQNLEKFIEVKHRLDPHNIFSNPFTNQILFDK